MDALTDLIERLKKKSAEDWNDHLMESEYPWRWGYNSFSHWGDHGQFFETNVSKSSGIPNKNQLVTFQISITSGHKRKLFGAFTENYSTDAPTYHIHNVFSVPDTYYLGNRLALTTERISVPGVGALLLQSPVQGMYDKTPIAQFFKELSLQQVAYKAEQSRKFQKEEEERSRRYEEMERLERKEAQLSEAQEFREVVSAIINHK